MSVYYSIALPGIINAAGKHKSNNNSPASQVPNADRAADKTVDITVDS